jgi:hypothetical protein
MELADRLRRDAERNLVGDSLTLKQSLLEAAVTLEAQEELIGELRTHDHKVETVFHVLGPTQIEKLMYDLGMCRQLGAGSAILMTSIRESDLARLEEGVTPAGISLDLLPEPDMITTTSLWTLGFNVSVELLEETVRAWGGVGPVEPTS